MPTKVTGSLTGITPTNLKGKVLNNLRKMDHDEFMKYGDNNPRGRADPAWNAERNRRYRNAQSKNYRRKKVYVG